MKFAPSQSLSTCLMEDVDTRAEKTNFDSHFFTQTQTTEQFNDRLKNPSLANRSRWSNHYSKFETWQIDFIFPFFTSSFFSQSPIFLQIVNIERLQVPVPRPPPLK